MPTKQWTSDRKLVTFWLTKDEKAAFRQACKKARLTQAKALRKAVLVMLGREA